MVMPSQKQIRQQVTDRIVAALEKDLLPWRRPWRQVCSPNVGRPANVVSKRAYSGINPLLLDLQSLQQGFESRWWGTFKQWRDLGCSVMRRPTDVKPGEWGAKIVFFRSVTKTRTDENGEERNEQFPLMRTYSVFNSEQVEGKAVEQFQVKDEPETGETLPNFAPAEQLIAATGAEIRNQGDRALYVRPRPSIDDWPWHTDGDYIVMPHRSQFDTIGAYYETDFHELAHHSEVRLGWDHREEGYAMGELVAEIAESFVCQELGVPQDENIENHVAYLQSWLSQMKHEPYYIFQTSSQASKTADYLLSFVRQSEEVAT